MAYARMAEDSDVYLISDVEADWLCVCCRIAEMVPTVIPGHEWYDDTELKTLDEVKAHMEAHLKVGHKVPDYCLERIAEEIAGGC
jgi:hypothetical protein